MVDYEELILSRQDNDFSDDCATCPYKAGTRITISNISLWGRWSHYLDSIIRVIKLLSEDVEEENNE